MPGLDFSHIDDDPDVFLWRRIAGVIEAAIRSGELPPRAMIPSEPQLRQMTGAGRNTVRRAVGDLRERGFLYVVPSLGTFVSREVPPA